MQRPLAPAQLVRITSLSQDLTVGVGLALASVRTLTDVSLVVHSRELVVLSGTRGAGEHALLAVIAGDRRGVTGMCEVDLHTRVRLMRIGASAAAALAQEWPRATQIAQSLDLNSSADNTTRKSEMPIEGRSKPQNGAELFLLDVVAGDSTVQAPRTWNESNRTSLLAWAALCQSRGGAVVMAAGQALGEGLFTSALARTSGTPPAKSREFPSGALQRSSVFERRTSSPVAASVPTSPVRVVVMHCGRLAPVVRLDAQDLAG